MIIKTKFFGEVKVDENKSIIFQDGIPGFEKLTKFLFMTDEEENSPFCWLQSIEDLDIVFTLFDPYAISEQYNPKVCSEEIINAIGEFEKDDILIYTVANVPKDITKISINLKAPIVINMKTNRAKQIISTNEDYKIKTYIYDQLKKGGE